MSQDTFTHLHLHTIYSFLDGFNFIDKMMLKAKDMGMTAIASTDHGNISSSPEMISGGAKHGIKPILGIEAYWTFNSETLALPIDDRYELAIQEASSNGIIVPPKATQKLKRELVGDYMYDTKLYHIILLALNKNGYMNLVKMQSEAAMICTFNGHPVVDDKLLSKYSKDVIMTTACTSSLPSVKLCNNNSAAAEGQILMWKQIFEDRFYLEIMPISMQEQVLTNYQYMLWAQRHGIPIIATTDSHYTNQSDHNDHDTLLCISMQRKKEDPYRLTYDNDFWLKSRLEMMVGFKSQTETLKILMNGSDTESDIADYMSMARTALDQTNRIAEQVETFKLGSSTPLLPVIDLPSQRTPEDELTVNSYEWLYKNANKDPEIDLIEYEKRLDEELSIINHKGFAPYMLIVKELTDWCKEQGIPVGPGRGSAAGSLCLFANGITKAIDPIKNNLLFSRFLTEDRKDLPDIDTDFSYLNRQTVIEHLREQYGADHVAQIGTFTVEGVKSGLKDVGKSFGIDFGVMNAITKEIDDISDEDPELNFKFLDNLENGTDKDKENYKKFKKLEDDNKELFRVARAIEGVVRNAGIHASGILITPDPVTDYFPVRAVKDDKNNGNKKIVTCFSGTQIDSLNGLKLDILGLKTLDVLDLTVKSIDQDMCVDDLYKMTENYYTDVDMFKELRMKRTEGLFQIESALFKRMVDDIKPNCFNDIVVINSLGRPGPLKAGMPQSYAKRKRKEEEPIEPLPNTWDLVEDTLGTICYQEQLMSISVRVAKFNLTQSDSYLRKAVGKKKKDLMDMCRQWFIYGKLNEVAPAGYDESDINQPAYDPEAKYGDPILGGIENGYDVEQLVEFWNDMEGYSSYLFNKSHSSTYSFITLCTMYLKQYHKAKFYAALLSMQKEAEDINRYINTARLEDVTVDVPSLNRSDIGFTEQNGKILFGLGSIKDVGPAALIKIMENRPFEDLSDLIKRSGVNKRVLEALIKAGALSEFCQDRHALLNELYDIRKEKERPELGEYNRDKCVEYENHYLGTTLTYVSKWNSSADGTKVAVKATIGKVSERAQKDGKTMAFIDATIDDGKIKALVFASIYRKNKDLLKENSVVQLIGIKDAEKIIVNDVAEEANGAFTRKQE